MLHLKSVGEECPEGWSKLEAKRRITEIDGANPAIEATPTTKTETEEMMVKLNRASRKTADLGKFCEGELNCTITDNDTTASMQTKGHDDLEHDGASGHGLHEIRAPLAAHLLHLDAQYLDWAIATAIQDIQPLSTWTHECYPAGPPSQ